MQAAQAFKVLVGVANLFGEQDRLADHFEHRLAAELGQSGGGGLGVLFQGKGLGDQQDIIGFIFRRQAGLGGIFVLDWQEDSPNEQANRNTGGNREEEK